MSYTKSDFEKIQYAGFTYNLSVDVIEVIQSLADKVGAPEYIKTPQFERPNAPVGVAAGAADKNKKRKTGPGRGGKNGGAQEVTDQDWETIRKFQATVISKKEGIAAAIDQIRKHLNKMTTKTYEVLKDHIIQEIEQITADSIDIETPEMMGQLHQVGEAIFDIASSNSFYSQMYASLFKALIEKFKFMNRILEKNFEIYGEQFELIEYCEPTPDYDRFCRVTKANEKRRALSLFYSNLMMQEVINPYSIMKIVTEMQHYLLVSIKDSGCRNIVEELSELLYIFILTGAEKLAKIEGWDSAVTVVHHISSMKPNSTHPSISNKTIFKHMDLLDTVRV